MTEALGATYALIAIVGAISPNLYKAIFISVSLGANDSGRDARVETYRTSGAFNSLSYYRSQP
jgi:hypothetical protein